MINYEKLKLYLNTKELGKTPELFDVYKGSTNDEALNLIVENKMLISSCVIAGAQTNGRGRMGRSWDAGKDQSVIMSVGIRTSLNNEGLFNIPPEKLPLLSLAAALAVRDALAKPHTGLKENDIEIKWPNDILINGKKICGILCEAKPCETEMAAVIGIGVNVSQTEFDKALNIQAASIFTQTGHIPEKERLTADIINGLERRILAINEFDRKEYNKYMFRRNMPVKILNTSSGSIDVNKADVLCRGILKGIDIDGKIIIEDESGILNRFSGGEVSLRE